MKLPISLLSFICLLQGAQFLVVRGKPLTDLSSSKIDFKCPEINGAFSAEEPCTENYYLCTARDVFLKSCPYGHVFDPVILSCILQEESSCKTAGTLQEGLISPIHKTIITTLKDAERHSTKNCTDTFVCPAGEPNGFYGIPCQVCSADYYACVDEELFTLSCPESLVFDTVEVSCVDPSQLTECSDVTTARVKLDN